MANVDNVIARIAQLRAAQEQAHGNSRSQLASSQTASSGRSDTFTVDFPDQQHPDIMQRFQNERQEMQRLEQKKANGEDFSTDDESELKFLKKFFGEESQRV